MTRFAFNRRLVDDQVIYIDAPTKEEAWRRARNDEADETDDPQTIRTTIRFIGEDVSYD